LAVRLVVFLAALRGAAFFAVRLVAFFAVRLVAFLGCALGCLLGCLARCRLLCRRLASSLSCDRHVASRVVGSALFAESLPWLWQRSTPKAKMSASIR